MSQSPIPSPLPPATAQRRGTMSSEHFSKLEAITGTVSGTNTGDVTVITETGWLLLVGQQLTFALVAASALVDGVVNRGAQVLAGVKTFSSKIIASIGLQGPAVWNTNGTGGSDVGVKHGLSTLIGDVHSTAKIRSTRVGLNGGLETELEYVDATGGHHTGLAPGYGKYHGAGDGNQYVIIDSTNGVKMYYSGFSAQLLGNFHLSGPDIEFMSEGKGVIFKTPDATKRYKLTVSNAGALTLTLL